MNTVYILGAGASKGAGIPQMNEFLKRAQEVQGILKFDEEFNKLQKCLRELDINKNPNISRELTFNLEEVLGCLDMEEYTGNINPNRPSKGDLVTIIFKTIVSNLPVFKVRFKERRPDLYKSYGEDESKYDEALRKFVMQLTNEDTIISFNYDVIIDYYLINNGVSVNYGFPLERYGELSNNGKYISLLKLHGSINWRACPECQKTEWWGLNYLFENPKPLTNIDTDTEDKLHELFTTEILSLCEHSKRKKIVKDILIVPPTWYKTDYPYEIIKKIWRKASEKLENAKRIIFIGYSFPQTDIHFKYLLLSSLAKNKNKFSVEVIDPKIQNTAGRYLEIFKDNISFKAMTFEDYILNTN